MPWYLNPKNLLLGTLAIAIVLMWLALEERKAELAGCRGSLVGCESQLGVAQAELVDARGVIEQLKRNVSDIKRQVTKWQQIASDAKAYADRLLAAAEAKVTCEEYHAENARLVNEFVDGFNGSVRRKILRPADGGSAGPTEVLPAPSGTDASKSDK